MNWNATAKELKNFLNPYPYRRFMRQRKCIFIHIPKTGGTSVLRRLGAERERKHIPWFVFYQSNRFMYEDYFKFAVVRNPYQRLQSVYSYLHDGGSRAGNTDLELSKDLRTKAPDFTAFVMDYLDPNKLHLHNLFRPQVYYICDYLHQFKVDMVCRMETLEKDFAAVASRLGLKEASLPHANKSSRQNQVLESNVVDRIQQLYESDFSVLGYSRDPDGDSHAGGPVA